MRMETEPRSIKSLERIKKKNCKKDKRRKLWEMYFLHKTFCKENFQTLYSRNFFFQFSTVRLFFPVCVLTPPLATSSTHLREKRRNEEVSPESGRKPPPEPAAEKYVAREKPTGLGADESDKRGESLTRREHRPAGSRSATGSPATAEVTGRAPPPRLRP